MPDPDSCLCRSHVIDTYALQITFKPEIPSNYRQVLRRVANHDLRCRIKFRLT